jgi:D-alanyl-D-alanine carboxypeptidase (penicillin-binding protein 5/6)
LNQTYFLDETGLDESETLSGGYGSAKDVALVLAYIYKINPRLIEATSKDVLTIESESGFIHTVHNTNKAFKNIPSLIGGKTGFTDLAGGNLAIVFDKGLGQPIIAVVLGSTKDERFVDMKKLVDASVGI